ncbi:MAG: FeoB-associated Cys-rich membrane protein [Deltaproteobacteria bacterium]|nr:FeoB-associated Cys-rich membrane protein [Deltaproteobacteria bacterium]
MNGQEWIALAIVALVAWLQLRSWLAASKSAARSGAACGSSCSGCPGRRPSAAHGACH